MPKRGGGEVKKAEETIIRGVFFAVDMVFGAVGNAMRCFVMMRLQQMVNLFQYNGLKDEQCEQESHPWAICRFFFH